MSEQKYMGDDDLIYNTSTRVPVCFCLDISGSMKRNDAIGQLNNGVATLYREIKANPRTRKACEIAIVTFNSEVKVEEDFSLVDEKTAPTFEAEGGTALAHAVEKGLELVNARKETYKKNGIDYFQPWIVIITDGKPGDKEELPAIQQKVKQLVCDKKLVVYPLVVGNDDNPTKVNEIFDILNGFCDKPMARHIKNAKYDDFFIFLLNSFDSITQSKVGDDVQIDESAINDWASL